MPLRSKRFNGIGPDFDIFRSAPKIGPLKKRVSSRALVFGRVLVPSRIPYKQGTVERKVALKIVELFRTNEGVSFQDVNASFSSIKGAKREVKVSVVAKVFRELIARKVIEYNPNGLKH